jgi:hypothetical protein
VHRSSELPAPDTPNYTAQGPVGMVVESKRDMKCNHQDGISPHKLTMGSDGGRLQGVCQTLESQVSAASDDKR